MAYEYPPLIAQGDYPDTHAANPPTRSTNAKISRRAHDRSGFNSLDEIRCSLDRLVVRSRTTGVEFAHSFRGGQNHAPIASAGAERFCFAPGVERLEIGWELRGGAAVTELTLTLYRPGPDEASAKLWTKRLKYAGRCPDRGHVYFDGDLSGGGWRALEASIDPAQIWVVDDSTAGEFPDGFVSIDQGPYKLELRISQHLKGVTLGTRTRWVYLDVLLAGVEIEWGDWRSRPRPRPDVIKQFTWTPRTAGAVAQTVEVRRRMRKHERELLKKLRVALPSADQDIVLDCNSHAFCTAVNPQFNDDTAYRRHRDMWGHGPRIPLWARLSIRRSDGQAVDAPLALGAAEFVWDWEEKPGDKLDDWLGPRIPTSTRNFLSAALAYKVSSDGQLGHQPLGATNCHADHGGKRGQGAAPIFPPMTPAAYADGTAAIIKHDFPFPVRAHPQRRWAALSQARRKGVLAGCTGVLFSPSRMAGDTYKVSVYLQTRDFPYLRTGPTIRSLVRAPFASTGVFTIFRGLRVHYLRLGASKTIDHKRVKALYREGGVLLEMGRPLALDPLQYQAALNALLALPPDLTSRFAPNLVPQNPQPQPRKAAVAVRAWGEFEAELTRLENANLVCLTVAGGRPFVHERLTSVGADADVLVVEGPDVTVCVNNGAIAAGDVLARQGAGANLNVQAVHTLSAPERQQKVNLLRVDRKTFEEQLPDNLSFQIAKKACRLYADTHHANDEGMFVFQFKTQYPGQRMVQPVRALAPSDSCEPHRAIFVAFTDYDHWKGEKTRTAFPGAPQQSSLKAWKPLDPVMAHEMGHNLCFAHAPNGPGSQAHLHEHSNGTDHPVDSKDHCLMNYHPSAVRFCGLCILRLRGWAALGPPHNAGLVALDPIANNNRVV